MIKLLSVLAMLTILGCRAPEPGFAGPGRILYPERETAEETSALDELREMVLREDDAEMTGMLLDLLRAETDGRAEAYLAAGKRAYLAGREELAKSLWKDALDCEPRGAPEIALDDEVTIRVYRPRTMIRADARDFPTPLTNAQISEDAFILALIDELEIETTFEPIVSNGLVLIAADPENHDKFTGFFRNASESDDSMVEVQMWFLDVTERGLDDFGIPLSRKQVDYVTLSEDEFQRILDAENSGNESIFLSSPRLVAFPYQLASVSCVNQIAYISDYEIESGIADPVVDTVNDGIIAEFRGIELSGGEIFAQVGVVLSEVRKPLANFTVDLGLENSAPVTIQIPEVSTTKICEHFKMGTGNMLYIPLKSQCNVRMGLIVKTSIVSADETINGED
ncbi:MAG: hypothetical protein NUW37_04300 [Planctomycetes bacterium]|nr:hypothetical protein [Planctomycetota bacterium]